MRLLSISVTNIAGLPDCSVDLPNGPTIGIAGQNGTGKSTFLKALLAPWTRQIPDPADIRLASSATIEFELTGAEIRELDAFGRDVGYNEPLTTERASVTVRRLPRLGIRDAGYDLLRHALQTTEFLNAVRSMQVMYVPAERYFASQGGLQVDLDTLAQARVTERLREIAQGALRDSTRLSEQQFEQWATAACVAAYLPRGDPTTWGQLKGAVDTLLSPKELLPLSAAEPRIHIGLPTGQTHALGRLSSGELQALIIIGNLIRAGADEMVAIIDEPDLHLHPILAAQMFKAISSVGLSQLVVASHSPFLLDSLETGSILHLRVGVAPTTMGSESERIATYQSFGFKVSELTQASVLVIPEGPADELRLKWLDPRLIRAAIKPAGGRDLVLRAVDALRAFDIPVIGVVDADVDARPIPPRLASHVVEWNAADLEAQLFQSDAVLALWLRQGWVRDAEATVASLRTAITQFAKRYRDSAIAEMTQAALRRSLGIDFPSPRLPDPIQALRTIWMASHEQRDIDGVFDAALRHAAARFDAEPNVLRLVRGKWIAEDVRGLTTFINPEALIQATIRQPEAQEALVRFITALDRVVPLDATSGAIDQSVTSVGERRDYGRVAVSTRRSRPAIGRSISCARRDVPSAIQDELERMAAEITAERTEVVGPPFSTIENDTDDGLEVFVGYPVAPSTAVPSDFESFTLQGREVATLEVTGSYADVETGYAALHQWLRTRDLEWDEKPREEYLERPPFGADGVWRVRIVQPIGRFITPSGD